MTQGGLHAGDQIPAATGTLSVGNDGAIHRGLVCARLSAGAPQLLPAGADIGTVDDDPASP